jgi:Cys-tRNA synthase (O-phospho-L-seryl-tRNA:Cys-tRNA synthase)
MMMTREQLETLKIDLSDYANWAPSTRILVLQMFKEYAEQRQRIQELEEWQKIVLGTGTDQEAVIRMAATEYTKVAIQTWKEANEKQRAEIARLDQLTTMQDGGIRSLHEQIVQKDAEIAELQEREQVAAWYETLVTRARIGTASTPSLKVYIEQLEARVARLREALKFYAEPQSYGIHGGSNELILGDAGKQARQAREKEHPFNRKRFEQAPCYVCGYNSHDYYQPSVHPCAARYHAEKEST